MDIIENYQIISSDIPWRKTSDNGQIYLDVDPICFRIIHGILKGTFDISADVPNISRPELALLKSTARYLMLDDVHEELEGFETGMMEEFKAALCKKDEEIAAREEVIVAKDEKIAAQDSRIERMRQKSAKFDGIKMLLPHLEMRMLKCNAHRWCRRHNRCGSKSMIIGALKLNPGAPCGKCNNDRDAICLDGGAQMLDEAPIRDVDDFVKRLHSIRYS